MQPWRQPIPISWGRCCSITPERGTAATTIVGSQPHEYIGVRPATRRTTDFADARFVIILEMCDRATRAVYFLRF